ncbi:MAG: chaperone modulator CbpM [Hyphomicrobiaceae bacterium]
MMMTQTELVARITRVTSVRIERWVGLGWLRPAQTEAGWQFAAVDAARCELLCDLVDDMGLDEEAIPVVLGLLDQLYSVRHELRILTEAVERQPDAVRQAIKSALASPPGTDADPN